MTLEVLLDLFGDVSLFAPSPSRRSAGWVPFLAIMGLTLAALVAAFLVLS